VSSIEVLSHLLIGDPDPIDIDYKQF
jgi:hypothetical protein